MINLIFRFYGVGYFCAHMEPIQGSSYLSPDQIARPFSEAAVKKAGIPLGKFLIYAFLGGMFIALGGLLSIMVAGGMPQVAMQNPGLVKLMAGAMFPIGLVLVVIAGAGLFTSDCATLPFAYWQKQINFRQVMQVAGWGYLANFAGALMVAWLLAYQSGTLTKEPWADYTTQMAVQKTSAGFWVVFIKGIGANLMVCLAVWMATAAKDIAGKVLLIWMPVMAFVAFGWEHSIANMFFIPLGMMLDAPVTISVFLIKNLLPATLGNIVGGALFVALPYFLLWGKTPKPTPNREVETTSKEKTISNREAIEQDLFKILN